MRVTISILGGALFSRRVGHRPIGRRIEVQFNESGGDLTLPASAELEVFHQIDLSGGERLMSSVRREYLDCRRFETETESQIMAERSPGPAESEQK